MTNYTTRLQNYIKKIEWDGVFRVGTWLHDFLGAADTDHSSFAGTMVIHDMVRRAFSPGCHVKYITVLKGSQGIGKSRSLSALAGEENFSPIPNKPDSSFPYMSREWVVDIPEIQRSLIRDSEKFKNFLFQKEDKYRMPYTKLEIARPRSFVFVGTSNDDKYIRGTVNDDRFLFVDCCVKKDKCDVEGLRIARDQLFAEAYRALTFNF